MRWNLPLVAASLLAAALACTPSAPAPGTEEMSVETRVAGTMTALAPAGELPSAPASATEPGGEGNRAIVYVDEGSPWILPAGGAARRLSDAGDTFDILISDDGQRIVFLRRDPSNGAPRPAEVRAVNADGSGETTLIAPSDWNSLHPPAENFLHNDVSSIAFIPGTHDLLLNTRAVAEGPGLIKYDDLLHLDGETGDLSTLLEPESGGDFFASADGTRVAVAQPDRVGLVDVDGSNLQPDLITYERVITYSEFEYFAQPIWSQDGQHLGVAIPTSDILADNPTSEVWQVAKDGSEVQSRGSFSGDFYFEQQRGGSLLSPTLDRVAFLRGVGGDRILLLAGIGASEETEYDRQVSSWSGWSPDGRYFIYAKGDPATTQLGEIEGAPRPLPNGTDFRWQSPGSFLFTAGSHGAWTLSRGTSSREVTELVSPTADFLQYDFSP